MKKKALAMKNQNIILLKKSKSFSAQIQDCILTSFLIKNKFPDKDCKKIQIIIY
jgi:hypothetical protein